MICKYYGIEPLCITLVFFILNTFFLWVMADEDYRTTCVIGEKCLPCWLCTLIGAALFTDNWYALASILVLFVLFWLPFEFTFFGDADMPALAAIIAVGFSTYIDYYIFLSIPIGMIIFAIPYTSYYCRHKLHIKWKPSWRFSEMQKAPVLPCFAFGWTVGAITWFIFHFIPTAFM